MTWPLAFVLVAGTVLFGCAMFLAAWRADRTEMREHAKAIHDAEQDGSGVRQEAFGGLMKRTEAAETEMQRLTDKVTTLQNRIGRA